MKSPQRGEVWLVDLGMAAKVRPAVVISVPADDSDRALVTLVPHTTSPQSSRFEVAVGVPFLRAGVFDAQNLVTIPHVHTPNSFASWGDSRVYNLGQSSGSYARGSESLQRGPRSNRALEPSRLSSVNVSPRRAAPLLWQPGPRVGAR